MAALLLVAAAVATVAAYGLMLARRADIGIYPMRPDHRIDCREGELYRRLLDHGAEGADWSLLDGTLEYVAGEYDCSDFRLVNLVRILYEYGDAVPQPVMERIERTVTGFRFWWDDAGGNSMCYWSENHQILFASAEYLLGRYFPDAHFTKAGLSGRALAERGRRRIAEWLELRWRYGFSEYCSNVYYREDIAALVNIIDYTDDEALRRRASIVLDLLFYDLVSHGLGGNVVSASSRAYRDNRRASDFDGLPRYLGGEEGYMPRSAMLYGLAVTGRYRVPPVMVSIFNDRSEQVVRQDNGIDAADLSRCGLLGTGERQVMMQFGMEAFVNPPVAANTMRVLKEKRMFGNAFLADLRWFDLPLVGDTWVMRALMGLLHPVFEGTALQRANTYTYRTRCYSIYTVQAHHPGLTADQQHVFGVNMSDDVSIYHTHPAAGPDSRQMSPNFWVGYGRLPHSVQERNVNLTMYRIPARRTMLEGELLDYTYLFVPEAEMDTVAVDGNRLFGRVGDAYCAFIAGGRLERAEVEGGALYIQRGRRQFWVTEMGSRDSDGDFRSFVGRVSANRCAEEEGTLRYESAGRSYALRFGGCFTVDGTPVDTDYDGYESSYVTARRDDRERVFACGGDTLVLNFTDNVRAYDRAGADD